ncbi:MAG TPA: NrsF family protein [Polyangiaceae bacterium]
MSAPGPSAELRARVLAAARAEPVPTRSAGFARRTAAVAVGVAASLLVLAYIGGPKPDGRPMGYFVAIIALWSLVVAAATWGGVSRGRSMLGRSTAVRVVIAALTPAALVVAALAAAMLWPAMVSDPSTMSDHLFCLGLGSLMAVGPLVAFALVRRGSDPVAPRLTGAALGAVAGAWGGLFIELRCGHASFEHVVLGHVVPVVVMTLLGALIAGSVVSVRHRT